jgi:hypothetical protein
VEKPWHLKQLCLYACPSSQVSEKPARGHLIKKSQREDRFIIDRLASWSAAVEGGSHNKGIGEKRKRQEEQTED